MKTLYKGPLYRVIHSTEEEAECLADGWLPTPEDGKQYIVHTAIEAQPRRVPSMEEVLAAGYSPMAAERVIARERRLAAGLPEHESHPIDTVERGDAPTSCFAPSIEAEKAGAPIVPPISASEYYALNHDTLPGAPPAGFCPEPESRTDAQPVMQMSATEYAEMTDPVAPSEPVSKSARRKSARIVKPNDAEVKALG